MEIVLYSFSSSAMKWYTNEKQSQACFLYIDIKCNRDMMKY